MNILHDGEIRIRFSKHRIVTRIIIGQKKALKKRIQTESSCDLAYKTISTMLLKADHKMTGHQGTRSPRLCSKGCSRSCAVYRHFYSCARHRASVLTPFAAHTITEATRAKSVMEWPASGCRLHSGPGRGSPPYRYAMIKIHTFSGG